MNKKSSKIRILVSDFHGGLVLAHQKLYESLGCEVSTLSLCHWYYVPKVYKFRVVSYFFSGVRRCNKIMYNHQKNPCPMLSKRYLLYVLAYLIIGIMALCLRFLPKRYFLFVLNGLFRFQIDYQREEPLTPQNKYFIERILQLRRVRSYFQQFDYIVCGFPPALFQIWLIVAEQCNSRIILNLGHRFNLYIRKKASNEQLKKDILTLYEEKKHIITTSSLYDYHYTEYYLGIKVPQLHLKILDVPLKKALKKDAKRVILITTVKGPVHQEKFNSEILNKKYQHFCQVRKMEPQLIFRETKKEVKWYDKVDELRGYMGILNFPYSSFSLRGLECYELNIPYFYPSLQFLMSYTQKEYQLCDCYCSLEEYRDMENDIISETAPNSIHPKAREPWLKYFSGLHTKNAILFDSFDDLFEKTLSAEENYDTISASMYKENKSEREKLQADWKKLLKIEA